ncbi:MAG TPA: hypothetical protein ENK31_01940, partial [Nannocystis exedens]|nr:hypothetical protein [Nannocystis exedens]
MRDRTLLITASTALLLLMATPAAAQSPGDGSSAPGADAFDIRYYITDENGARGRQMTANDMLYFVNQARCECGQKIDTQIRLLNTGTTYDQILIDSFVGTQCATAENAISQQYKPCIEFPSVQTNSYYAGKSLSFSPIWL